MHLRYDNFCYYIENYTPLEYKRVSDALSWFERSGTLKELKVGDWVKVKPGIKPKTMKFGTVRGIKEDKVEVSFDDGSEHTYKIFGLERHVKTSLLFEDNENGGHFFYYGLHSALKNFAGIEFTRDKPPFVIDKGVAVPDDLLPGITYDDFQKAAILKCLLNKHGLCVIPTGGGKSIIILSIIKYLVDAGKLRRGIIMVPTVHLAKQLNEDAKKFGINYLGELHADTKNFDAKVIVGVAASICLHWDSPVMLKVREELDAVLADECQHLQSDSWMKIVLDSISSVTYLLGFSGSPFLYDNPLEVITDATLYGITGGIIFQIGYDHLIAIGRTSQPYIFMKKVGSGLPARTPKNFTKAYEVHIVKNKERNTIIEKYVRTFYKHGFQTLILVQRLEHAEILMTMLKDLQPLSLFGGDRGVFYSDLEERVEFNVNFPVIRKQIADGYWKVVFGSQVLDEGVDCLDADTEILTNDGWAGINNIKKGDLVYSLNPVTKQLELSPAIRYMERFVSPGEKMVRIKSQHLDIRVTENHNFVFSKHNKVSISDDVIIDKYDTMPQFTTFYLNGKLHTDIPGIGWNKDKLWLLGMIWTDGCAHEFSYTISQSKPNIINKIRSTLSALGVDFTYRVKPIGAVSSKFKQNLDAYEFKIPKGTSKQLKRRGWKELFGYDDLKSPCDLLYQMNKEEFLHFYSGLIDGNGGYRSGGRVSNLCISNEFQFNFITHKAAILGMHMSYWVGYTKLGVKYYILRLYDNKLTHKLNWKDKRGAKLTLENPKPNEKVWCVTNKNGTLISRRNGKVVVLGNCPSIDALVMAGGGKSRIKSLQRLGRGVRRKLTGLNRLLVLEFQDNGHIYLKSHSNVRRNLYNSIGAKLIEEEVKFQYYIQGKL